MLEVKKLSKLLIVRYTITILSSMFPFYYQSIAITALIWDALLQPYYFYVGSVNHGLYHEIFKSYLSDKTFK